MGNIWQDGMYGLIVSDALGVPVEFTSRADRIADPVTGMREYGTHNQPKGTWSDDSSMAIATMDSILTLNEINYADIMEKFKAWRIDAEYTPFKNVFDIGISTTRAITRYILGTSPIECGGTTERDNGNGSLMRIMPVCLFMYEKQKKVCTSENESIHVIHSVSSLTHGHARSMIACGIYYFLVKAIIEGDGSMINRLQKGMDNAYKYYRQDLSIISELQYYDRLIDLKEFKNVPDSEIKSSGYVVDTLEAAVWCLINTDSYEAAALKSVNLGSDTDTVGAVTGGLAGLFYGIDNIPKDWLDAIQCKDWIDGIMQK